MMKKLAFGVLSAMMFISLSGLARGYMGPSWGPGGTWGPPWGGYGMQQMMDYCFERMSLAGWPGSGFGWWRGEGFIKPA